MILNSLKVTSFRNYSELNVTDFKQINLVHGENGQGKTSFIEAIYYTALTQSFKAKSDNDCLNYKDSVSEFFEIECRFINNTHDEDSVRVFYSKKEGKNLFINSNKEKRFKNHIGFIPVVLIKPDDNKITFGAPGDRRKFIDLLLSQISPLYLDSLMKYRKIIKHKNALLIKQNHASKDLLLSWNSEMVKHGSYIIKKRYDIIHELNVIINDFYQKISNKSDIISIEYASPVDTKLNIENEFQQKLNSVLNNELLQKKNLCGPHRDDFVFKINNKIIGQYGSQGENKTLLISLKLAELELLKKYIDEKPILLFDDIFSELDSFRVEHLMDMIHDSGQVFITSTSDSILKNVDVNKIKIHNGMVVN